MKYKILRQTEQKVTKWAGGTTTELFVFPQSSSYLKRNFCFRLSTATVKAESSLFTSLPGYTRILMILEGRIEIHHEGKYSKVLKKYDQDTFDGSWTTISRGRAVDFNLMMAQSVNGSLRMIHLTKNENLVFNPDFNNAFSGVYVFKGQVRLSFKSELIVLEKGDFFLVDGLKNDPIKILPEIDAEIVISSIQTTDNVRHPSPSPDMLFVPGRLK